MYECRLMSQKNYMRTNAGGVLQFLPTPFEGGMLDRNLYKKQLKINT